MKGLILALAGLLAVSAIHDPAAAQAVPDIQDAISRGNSIDDALREQRRTSLQPSAEDEGEIDGEAGVYVLTVNDIFFVGASVGSGWEENPVRTIDDVGNSVFATAAVSAGIQTKLGDTIVPGQHVMDSGDTGRSGAPHLHIEIRVENVRLCPQPALEAIYTGASPPAIAALPTAGCAY